jgi:hypothetical protein
MIKNKIYIAFLHGFRNFLNILYMFTYTRWNKWEARFSLLVAVCDK